MQPNSRWMFAALVGVTLGAGPALAQRGQPARPATAQASSQATARPIRFGEAVNGTLAATDPKYAGRGAFHTYRFDAKADKHYIITLDSPDFDAWLWVARIVGGLSEELAQNDDGGEGTNSRLRFRPPAAGSYVIVAQSLSEEGLGAYTVKVEETDPPPPPSAQTIEIGATVRGELTEMSAIREEDGGAPYDLYNLSGRGQRVRILMRSQAFDAYLHVLKVLGSSREEVATDDDSGGNTDARINLTLDGDYVIIARSLGSSGRGEYTLSVSEAEVVRVVQRPIAVGQTMSGVLSESDPELDGGGYFHEYVLDARAGDRFRITLRSGDFDSYLRWGTKSGDAFTEISTDDDSGGDLDSQLEVRVERAGTYVIRASALGSGSTGAYSLTLERAP